MITLLALTLVASLADGDAAMTKGDYDAAVREYRAEAAQSTDSYEAKFKLARALSFSNHRDEAIRIYTELLAASPDNSDLLLARGRTYAWDGRWDEAEKDVKNVTGKLPDYGDAWSALGDIYLWSDRPADAAIAYGKWIAASPGDSRAYVARARAWRAAGDTELARADFEAARSHGAPDAEIDGYLSSLQRREEPEAVAPGQYDWLLNLSAGTSRFTPVVGEWNYYSASLRHYWKTASLAFEFLDSQRFQKEDYAFALDAYVDLWPRAYVNLRMQYGPHIDLFPYDAYRAELFQGVGRGWELSASYDHMYFGETNVDMYGAGLGKYIGDWYLRWKVLLIPAPANKLSVSHRFLVRYYYAGNGDDYIEANGGYGEGGEYFQGSGIIETTRNHGYGAAFQKYFTPQWGFKVAVGYGENNVYPFMERYVSGNILRRW